MTRTWRRLPMPPPIDSAVAVALFAVVCLESQIHGRFPAPVWLWLVTSLLIALPLAWRRRFPFPVQLIDGVAIVVQGFAASVPQSSGLFVASLLATYSVAVHSGARARYATLVLLAVVMPLYLSQDPATTSIAKAIPSFIIQGAAFAIGSVVRRRGERASATELAAEATTRDVTAAAANERQRIAHELHDVVAHGLSLMVVQATAARVAWERGDPVAGEGLRAVEDTGRAALREMRWLLGVLRTDGEPAEHAPTPGLDDLPQLLESVRRTGLDLTLVLDAQGPFDASMELSLYRITQEALTNVVKHAGATSVQVALRREPRRLVLSIEDNGVGPSVMAHGTDSGGTGQIGMRERAAVFGGTISAGPQSGGGYAVTACLPLEPVSA